MPETLKSYIAGRWQVGKGTSEILQNPTTEQPIFEACTDGLDIAEGLAFARAQGGPELRKLTFAKRAGLLSAMAKIIHEHREELLTLSMECGGNTRGDAKFDIDGASGSLAYYAKLGEQLGETHLWADGGNEQLGRNPRYAGRHVHSPRLGVAVHINAFNFPAWGLAEKAAAALLAGMPVFAKPASCTAPVATRIVQCIVDADVLPAGALSILSGQPQDLLDHLEEQDVVAFTGSAATATTLRQHPTLAKRSIPLNVEADSLNAAVLGPDVERDSDTYDLFMREVVRELTQKAGQKCTALRRIFVPAAMFETVCEDLRAQAAGVVVGDPSLKQVAMGPLASETQAKNVLAVVHALMEQARPLLGDGGRGSIVGVDGKKGYFMSPTLLVADNPRAADKVHRLEPFGPVATLMPYDGSPQDAAQLVALGRGALVSSFYSDDFAAVQEWVAHAAAWHGRLHLGSAKIAEHSMGSGIVLPQLHHGGPGRAGAGSELGGLRALPFYMQRTAVQGYAPWLDKLVAA